jgi:hypothetical protein
MRMHTGGCKQHAGIDRGNVVGRAALALTGAGDDYLRDPGPASPLQHLGQIVAKAIVAQVRADIDEFHGVHHNDDVVNATQERIGS